MIRYFTPRPHLSGFRNSQTVQRSDGDVDDPLPPESLHHLGLPHVHVGAVAQPEVVALSPVREHEPAVKPPAEESGAARCSRGVTYQVHTTPDLVRAKEN